MTRIFYLVVVAISMIAALGAHAQIEKGLKPEHEDGAIRRRFEDFMDRRQAPGTTIPAGTRSKAVDHVKRMERSKATEMLMAEQPQWLQFGPRSTGGRIKSILIHPENTNIVYIAAAAGGVWKSTDGGTSWTPKMDDANAIAMGSLCFDPVDPNIIYAGTGEQVTNANTYLGAGLMVSTDAGETWSILGLSTVGSFSRIYAHPKNRDLLMASCMNTNAGVYKSLDRGKTWTQVYEGTAYDMSINPNDENEWFIAVPEDGIMYTANGGQTWERRASGLIGTFGRTSVQQSPVDPNVVYALVELNSLATIAKSSNKGLTWTVQYNDTRGCFFAGSCDPGGSQGFYDNYVSVSPVDANVCFVGGIDIWRTTNGGTSWSNQTGGYGDGNGANLVHVDQHCLAYDPKNPTTIYAGNDGGMVKSTNNGATWFLINDGLSVTQFYSFDVDPTRRERAFGGTQDNGTLGTFGDVEWDTVAGGDGMVTIVNHKNPDVIYGNYPNGVPYRINLATQEGRIIIDGIDQGEPAAWVAPMIMHPTDDQILFHGRRRLWRTFDAGDFWFEASPTFVNQVSAIACSPADPTVIWAGSAGGELMVAEDDGFEWQFPPRTELANRFVSDIACSRTDRATAWITYSAVGTANVWRTTDLGKTWTSLWEGMPDIPVNAIEVHPDDENILFIATDVGVFATFDGGKIWVPYGKGLPRSPALDIKVNGEFGYIRVVTHGRSAWEAPLIDALPNEPVIVSPGGGDIYTGTLSATIAWAGFTPPVKLEFSVDDGQKWDPIAENVVGTAMRWKVPNWPTVNARIRVTSMTDVTQQQVSRTFTIQTLDKGGILQQSAVNWVPYGLAWDGNNGLWTTSFYERKLYKLDATTLKVLKTVELPANVGDSLFTDLTMDRATGTLYIHKLNGSDGVGAMVIVADTNGAVKRVFASQARRYATGLELVQGNLIAGERDGFQKLYVMDMSGGLISEHDNPYQETYGPRCLAWDDIGTMYQTCTTFPGGGSLSACYLISFKTSDLSTETARMPLNSPTGLINARGVEYDRNDENFWISDFGGNIYKITGFNFVPPPISSVDEPAFLRGDLHVAPNPASTSTLVQLAATTVERRVTLTVVDLFGREISTLYNGIQGAGTDLTMRWTTSQLPSGTYRIVASTNGSFISSTALVINH